MNRGERIAARHYRLRGYRIVGANAPVGGYELDLIARAGGRGWCSSRSRSARRAATAGPSRAVDREKRRRVRRAAGSWLHAHPEAAALEIRFEVAAITDGRIERLDLAPDWT